MKKFYVLYDENEKITGLYKLTEGEAAIIFDIFEKIGENDVNFCWEFDELGRMNDYYENKEY